jgi:hypothetical protein
VGYFEGLSDVLQQKNMLKMQNFALIRPFAPLLWLFDCRFLPKPLWNAFIAMILVTRRSQKNERARR